MRRTLLALLAWAALAAPAAGGFAQRPDAPASRAPAQLGTLVEQDAPEIGPVLADVEESGTVVVDRGPSSVPRAAEGQGGGCASCAVGEGEAPFVSLGPAVLLALLLCRRRA